MPTEQGNPYDQIERVPNAELAKQIFDRALRCDGSPLTAEQIVHGYMAVCRVAHVAKAERDDPLVESILQAVRKRGAMWPPAVLPLYNRTYEGGYEILAAVVGIGLTHEERWPAMLAAILIVRPEDVHRLVKIGASLTSVHPVG